MDPRTRLYLEDPDLLEFDATIVERRPLPDGDVGVVLDRTAFYPTSGGQPHDTGALDTAPVLEVMEAADGAIVHRVRQAPQGDRVRGRVDGERRRDHMQQHSGQHLLSATFVALCGRDTDSFHLGAERCSIDLPGSALAPAELEAVERRANAIIWEARPVRARLLSPADAAGLRQPPPVGARTVRVIEIEDWDVNACCGTHVRRTSEIGLVKLLGQERTGGGTRLHFACGARALAACAAFQARIETLVRLLTCHPDELGERFERLVADGKAQRKENDTLQAVLAEVRAATWLAAAPHAGGVPLVVQEVDAGGTTLGLVAASLVASGAIALLGSRAERAQLLFARPESLTLDLRPAMQIACAAVEGKGGGPPARVQGSGPRLAGLGAALAAARAEVLRQLGAPPESF